MLKLVVISIVLGIALAANHPDCGQKGTKNPINENYIVGGVDADPQEWPWQVSLQYNSAEVGWYHTCGGSVINEQWVITAAHCTDRSKNNGVIDPNFYRVVIGEHDRSKDEGTESIIASALLVQHPQWDSAKINNDVTIIKLARPINFKGNESHVKPVCLPDSKAPNLDDIVGTQCVATGWGHKKWQASETPPILQKVSVNVVTQSSCKSIYSFITTITDQMICFGENGKGTCQGDSGGPLNCLVDGKWHSYGITSFGVQCAGMFPSVSCRTSEMSSWVWQNVASN